MDDLEKLILKKLSSSKDLKNVVKEIERIAMLYQKRGQKGEGLYSGLINRVVTAYNTARGKREDKRSHKLTGREKHAVLKNKDGALGVARFAGPGTALYPNLVRLLNDNDGNLEKALKSENFISPTDKLALHHDIQYQLYSDDPERIRVIDENFDRQLKRFQKLGDSSFNTVPSRLVGAKVGLEKGGILRKGSFAEEDKSLTTAQNSLLRKAEQIIERDLIFAPDEKIKKEIETQFGNGRPKIRLFRQMGGKSIVDSLMRQYNTLVERWEEIRDSFPVTLTEQQTMQRWAVTRLLEDALQLINEGPENIDAIQQMFQNIRDVL